MASDYFPRSFINQQTFLTNLKAQIQADGPGLGRTAPQLLGDTALIDDMLNAITAAITKETAAVEAAGVARAAVSTNNEAFRQMINGYKALPDWDLGKAKAWGVQTSNTDYDMTQHQPTITVSNVGGQLVIRGKKPGFTSVSIDMRVAGTPTWTTIGVKLSHFPFIDTTVAQTPGKPEAREYRGRGYVGDNEAGQPSDIVSAIYS